MSTFIPNKLIANNIIIGYECLQKIRHNKGKRNRKVTLKPDISKAYYDVQWGLLKETIRRLGFSNWCIKLISSCIITLSFSMLVHVTSKGLRGDYDRVAHDLIIY